MGWLKKLFGAAPSQEEKISGNSEINGKNHEDDFMKTPVSELLEESPTSNFDDEIIYEDNSISYNDIFNTIEKYFKNKNEDYKSSIGLTLYSNSDQKISSTYIRNEIERLSSLIDDPTQYDEEYKRSLNKDMVKFYEDLFRLQDFFSDKGAKVSINQIFNIFRDVQEVWSGEVLDDYQTELFDIIEQRLSEDQNSQIDIIKEFILYNIEEGDIDIVYEKCLMDLQDLLGQFGYVHDDFSDDLNQMVMQALEEIGIKVYESDIEVDIDSSYDEISNHNETKLSNGAGNRKISSKTKREVWRRDEGKCSNCGSRENLEYDHIIPVSKGGSNTARNVELLCQKCNREKSNKIQ